MEKKEILLTNRHVSFLLSFFILSCFFVFISGYFFGKKKAIEEFHGKAERESLADHVYYSVCSNYGNYDRQQVQESTEDEKSDGENSPQDGQENGQENSLNLQNKIKQDVETREKDLDQQQVQDKQEGLTQDKNAYKNEQNNVQKSEYVRAQKNSQKIEQENLSQKNSEHYFAELVGFGTKVAANAFCNKLTKQGITVALKKRISRTSRGKNIYWYQVVTEKFDNKSDLIEFVDIIKDKENLKGVKIIQC